MGKSVADISMSLDGFVTGPDPGPDSGLGTGGEPLHAWAVGSTDDIDAAVLHETTEATGAVVMGRRLFDIVDGPFGWDDEMGYGAGLAAMPPVFVVTHTIPTAVRLGARFRFVRGGVAEAIREAHGAASGLDVIVMGGAETVRQALDSGLVDELRIHLAPILLGSGTPLFSPGATTRELVQMASRASPNATHITYGTRAR